MKNTILLLASMLITQWATAQHQIKGKVIDLSSGTEVPLYGAFLHWVGKDDGTYANSKGEFSIAHAGEQPFLVVSYVGYETDTFEIKEMHQYLTLQLFGSVALKGATVSAKRITYGLQSKDAKFTISLDEREFQKAACCNLSESFENAPAIDVSIADAITGTKQIKMLGLDGFYTLITKEYMPAVRTLNSYYGLSLIPASWVSNMQITKGAGSVVNGYESMAGQINIQMKNPFGAEKFMFDQFFSQAGRSETDLMYRHDLSKYVSTSGFARIALYPGMIDNNSDGFMDMPAGQQYAFMNRWKFATDKNVEGELTGTFINDTKRAGQRNYYKLDDHSLYGVTIENKQWGVDAKLGRTFADKPYKSFGSQYSINQATQLSTYGSDSANRVYEAASSSYYGNFLFQSIFGDTRHSFQTGVSILLDQLDESIDSFEFSRSELVTGAFLEYTFKPSELLSVVAGLRTDYNSIFGLSITPRLHTKWRLNGGNTSIRASVGMGRRTSNIFAQHQQVLASQRSIKILETEEQSAYGLTQEVSINSGFSIEHKYKLGYIPSVITLDYFNTRFFNEVVVDREDVGLVRFYNMEDGTRSNSLQLQLDLNPMRRTDIRFAYRMFDVSTKYKIQESIDDPLVLEYRTSKPFVAKHRAFVNLTQSNRSKWQLSTTLHWTGQQRIAGMLTRNEPNFSDPFFQWNAQLSKTLKRHPIEFYVGVDNLLNYQQPNPIVGALTPFQSQFDAGMVWGPIFGRMIYGGFRWRIKKSYNDKINALHEIDHE